MSPYLALNFNRSHHKSDRKVECLDHGGKNGNRHLVQSSAGESERALRVHDHDQHHGFHASVVLLDRTAVLHLSGPVLLVEGVGNEVILWINIGEKS